MKINLETKLNADTSGAKKVRLGDVIEKALFQTQVETGREIYNKVQGKKEVELTVKELSAIQDAIDPVFIPGVKWQVDEIFNSNGKEKD